MNRTATGVFETYAEAGRVVRELELLGISGEQVEVVSDAASDVRGAGVMPASTREAAEDDNHDCTLVIVRPSDDRGMEQARHLMHQHGAKLYRWQISADGAPDLPIKDTTDKTTPDSNIGGPGTTGGDPRDLEGRGKRITEPRRPADDPKPHNEQHASR